MKILFFALALPCLGQMTPEQRLFDFEHLAAQYAKFYGPYEWKRDVIGFDAYRQAMDMLRPGDVAGQRHRDVFGFGPGPVHARPSGFELVPGQVLKLGLR